MSSPARHPEATTNRYLAWLEQGAAPPLRGSLAKAEEAARHFYAQMRLGKRLFSQTGRAWEALSLYLAARQRFYAVLALVESQAGVSKRMKPELTDKWRMAWDNKADRLSDQVLAEAGKVLRRMKRQTRDFRRQRELSELLEQLDGDSKLDAAIRRQSNDQKNRERCYVQERKAVGGPHCDGLVSGLHRDYLRAAKQAAADNGLTGYQFPMNSVQADSAITEADHPELRRLLWWESSYAPVPAAAVERMRTLRHQQALSDGFENFAQRQLRGSAFNNPQRIARTLRQGQEALAKDVKAFRQETLRYLNTKGELEPVTDVPWDWSFALSQTSTETYKDLRKVFPWRETALKVFSELFQKTGWKPYRPARVSGEGIWSTIHFHFQRQDGRQAHVIYAPFRPNENEHSYSAGQACAILNSWDNQGTSSTPQVIWIDQALDKTDQCFERDDLRVLCHEIGHALHYMSLPGYSPEETTYLPEDIFEIPSYLFELYVRDPAVLARWASKKGPAACRRARHWVRSLKWENSVAVDHHLELRDAQMDLRFHCDMERSFLDICKDSMESIHEEDGSWRRTFIWDEHLVCLDYTQTVPKSLVRRLVTVPDHGRVNSQLILDTYLSLLDNVLASGISADRIRQSWKRWTGETFSTSFKTAVVTHARQSARITRRATQKLRKKTQKLAKR